MLQPRRFSVRLSILDNGHGIGAKLMFAMIRLFSGQRVVDAVKLVMYRPDFYGNPMKQLTHEAMRGPSAFLRFLRPAEASLPRFRRISVRQAEPHITFRPLMNKH